MTLVIDGPTNGPNRTLKDHKLLILTPWKPSPSDLESLRSRYPGLKIVFHELAWSEKTPRDDFPREEWEDVTILVTGSALPSRRQAPKLQYVQLMSAGANLILKNPLFTDTDVTFCTANGVHG